VNARQALLPLVPLYAAAIALKNAAYATGLLRPRRLRSPVINVGSLSAGGAGKTPFVILLINLLKQRGYSPDVLTRGYGRSGNAIERVEITGDAARFGDEPLLLAQKSGVPVFVGAARYQAGLLAELNEAQSCVHLLDDGFQHRKLARIVDIVLLTQRDLQDGLLPAGNLREPLSSLRRAQIAVVREDEPNVIEAVRKYAPHAVVWIVRRNIILPAEKMPQRPLFFCGIARPQDFAADLRALGCNPAAEVFFPDHQKYSPHEIARLLKVAGDSNTDGFITTEKDAVKFSSAMREQLNPLIIAELHLELRDAHACMDALIKRL